MIGAYTTKIEWPALTPAFTLILSRKIYTMAVNLAKLDSHLLSRSYVEG